MTDSTTFDRKPTTWLNYQGDVRQILDGGPLGPTDLGQMVYPVTADYDAETNKTRVGLTFIAPAVTA